MLRVALKLLLAAAALAAVWTFVPIHGRPLSDRWHRAHTAREFVVRTLGELRGQPALPATPERPHPAQRAQARSEAPKRPSESHTEADRKALDQILANHLDGH
jgi:hypothetical protein